ncbi:MAG TPA: hypothetical protein VLL98_04345 [Rickettsiales bacterium]|nr:hypothetical protein [Rickettsiales bacterium]
MRKGLQTPSCKVKKIKDEKSFLSIKYDFLDKYELSIIKETILFAINNNDKEFNENFSLKINIFISSCGAGFGDPTPRE